jgi:hypothetical protein
MPSSNNPSKARLAANRANARRSTGPKSAKGKARAAKNALRHGLNVVARDEVGDSPKVVALASRLGAGRDPATRAAAEAELNLQRIRKLKRNILLVELARASTEDHEDNKVLVSEERLALALVRSADELLKLDGYERKSRSRRKKAFRALG